MDSDNQQQQQQLGSYGLLRFRSAPSLLSLSDEIDTSRFMNYGGEESPATLKESPVGSPRGYAALPPQYPRPSSGRGSSSGMEGSYYRTAALVSSNPMAAEHHQHQHQPKSVSSSLLMRQSSSPPDLFSQLPSHHNNGYNTIRGSGNSNYRSAGGGLMNVGEISSPPSNRLKGHSSFSSSSSSLGINLSQMSDFGTDTTSRFLHSPGFPFNSWTDSSQNFVGLKREDENHDIKMFNTSLQNGELGNRHPMIPHRTMSLPRTSTDMAAMEKFLQLQDSVPCKIRAKRGCATHPRSIAERVRRTRISERMRKLQELVPNMDKQTNTADMLDLAVDYIKDLQNEFKSLNDRRANCKCMSMQNAVASNQRT